MRISNCRDTTARQARCCSADNYQTRSPTSVRQDFAATASTPYTPTGTRCWQYTKAGKALYVRYSCHTTSPTTARHMKMRYCWPEVW